jgi:broad specificity phosphatase PhoE
MIVPSLTGLDQHYRYPVTDGIIESEEIKISIIYPYFQLSHIVMASDIPHVPVLTPSSLPSAQVWLRHGAKAYDNNKNVPFGQYTHDPPLTDLGYNQIIAQTQELLRHYAPPKEIICSPYLRCRQSAEAMQGTILEISGITVPIIWDRWLGEFLGHHPNIIIAGAVTPETLSVRPMVEANIKSFHKRMKNIIKHHKEVTDVPCWYVTHGIVVNHWITYWRASSAASAVAGTQYPGRFRQPDTGAGFALTAVSGKYCLLNILSQKVQTVNATIA